MSTREIEELSTKQEGGRSTNDTNNKIFSTPSSWSRSKDPRIVQVSRAFGGKDRHTKVCTVKGLRDRRVRLSVSTAIQLYDLQDRLGLNQPSKVVDWLLNAAKDDIDELPPLQVPLGLCFPQNLECSENNNISKEIVEEDEEGRESPESLEGLMNNSNNNSMTYNSWTRWDASNLLTLSHASQPPEEQFHNFGTINYMPTGLLSQQYPSHQGLVHQSYLSSNNNASVEDFERNKHIGLQMWSTGSLHHQQSDQHQQQNVRPFHFSMMTNRESEPNKESEYDSSR